MKGEVHVFEAREAASIGCRSTYQDRRIRARCKTSGDTDTFQGRFVELVPDEKIVEVATFESRDPRFAGDMKITTRLTDTGEGTRVAILCETSRQAFGPQDNERAVDNPCRKLAALLGPAAGARQTVPQSAVRHARRCPHLTVRDTGPRSRACGCSRSM